MKKTIIFSLLGVVIGLVIGCLGTMVCFGYNGARFMFLMQEKEIFEVEISAIDAYHNQSTEVAIWAIEKYINTLNRLKEERADAEVENLFFLFDPDHSLVFSHARLGQLYKKLNDAEKSKYHFGKAMSKSKKGGFPAFDTEEELIDFIHKVDSSVNDDAIE